MKKTDVSSLQVGEFMSETQYYKVVDIIGDNPNRSVLVENERGMKFSISADIVEEGIFSASQAAEVVELTRTELIEVFKHVGDTVFTVCFNKQPAADEINTAIESLNKGKIVSIKEMKKTVKEAFKGEERVLTGYLISTETGYGRSMVIDLALSRGDNPNWDSRIRQVDHRTLSWLISKNVKYIIKKK